MRRVLLGVLAALALLASGTYVAGELTEVAVLRTRDADGRWRDTKLWVVDIAGTPWVRVARPERAWFRRLASAPEVALVRGGRETRHTARPHPEPEARTRVDAAFRAKYGAVDAWYGLLVRSDPIPVELVAQPEAGQAHRASIRAEPDEEDAR